MKWIHYATFVLHLRQPSCWREYWCLQLQWLRCQTHNRSPPTTCGRRMCKEKQSAATKELEASGIVVAITGKAQSQSCIWVTVCWAPEGRKPARIQAVWDTGAQVCVTGSELLAILGIRTVSLKRGGSL